MITITRSITLFLLVSFALVSFTGCFDDNISPVALFSMYPESIQKNSTILLNSSSFDEDGIITNISWFCNDELIGYTTNVSYFIAENGSYTFTLIVEDDQGEKDSIEKSIIVGSTDDLKEYFIGSWEWSGNNQTGLWIFYQNNSLKSTFTGIGGATVTYWWRFEVNGSSQICFDEPSDPKLSSACYEFEFKDNFSTVIFTTDGSSAEWHKIR
jgi:PKD repeat protein